MTQTAYDLLLAVCASVIAFALGMIAYATFFVSTPTHHAWTTPIDASTIVHEIDAYHHAQWCGGTVTLEQVDAHGLDIIGSHCDR